MLLKWWWKWYSDRGALWWRVIKEKYNLKEDLGLEQCRDRANMSPMLKDISHPYNADI